MDAHKNSIAVEVRMPGRLEPVEWQEATAIEAIVRLGRKLLGDALGAVRCCYEAGPTGYALQRQLRAAGVECTVIAPSLTPVKTGVELPAGAHAVSWDNRDSEGRVMRPGIYLYRLQARHFRDQKKMVLLAR